MKKLKLLFFAYFLFLIVNIYSRNTSNYVELFKQHRDSKIGINYNDSLAVITFFDKLNSTQKIDAIEELTEMMKVDDLTYFLLPILSPELVSDTKLVKYFSQKILDKNSNMEFRMQSIPYITSVVKRFNSEIELDELTKTLFTIVLDEGENVKLRATTLGRIFIGNDHNNIKNSVYQLTLHENFLIANAAFKAIKINLEFIKDEDFISDLAIQSLEKHKYNLDRMKSAINILGNIKIEKSRNYLLKLLNHENKDLITIHNSEIFSSVLHALSKNVDMTTLIEVFKIFSDKKNSAYSDSFESIIILRSFMKTNIKFIKEIPTNDDSNKIIYLKATKYLKGEVDKEILSNIKLMLFDLNVDVRIQAINTLHYLLPHNEEVKLFRPIIQNEQKSKSEESYKIINTIVDYIGYKI